MNQDADQLRDAFVAHEYLAPDAAEVLAVVHERARRYRRRRRAAQGAGGAVLGAGLVAGSVAAPGWLNDTSARHGGSTISLAAPAPQPTSTALTSPAPAASPSPLTAAQQEQALSAYFAAGYDYNDALALAQLWHMSGDPTTIKAEAGRRLLAGQQLPFKPSPEAVASAAEDNDLNAFFAAGYTYEDAVGLAQLWKISDPYQAKIDAGTKLLAGVALPIAPGSQPTPAAEASANAAASASNSAVNEYFSAGYTYDDAVTLGRMWKIADTYQVKIDAGQKLLAGQTLPIRP